MFKIIIKHMRNRINGKFALVKMSTKTKERFFQRNQTDTYNLLRNRY